MTDLPPLPPEAADALRIRCLEIVRPIYDAVCDDRLVSECVSLVRAPVADEATREAIGWRASAACRRLIGEADEVAAAMQSAPWSAGQEARYQRIMGASHAAGMIPFLFGSDPRVLIPSVAKAAAYAAQADALDKCVSLDDVRAVEDIGFAAEDAITDELTAWGGQRT